MSILAELSGGGTKTARSKRPGRRRAPSTSQGALVAPRTKMPSFWLATPSSSASSWLTTPRRAEADRPSPDRERPRASISSKNSTQGACDAGVGEEVGDVVLALAHPAAEHVREPHGDEPCPELTGDRAGQVGLSAPRRAVQQQATSQGGPVPLPELRIAQWGQERGLDVRLDLREPADVGQAQRGLHRFVGQAPGEVLLRGPPVESWVRGPRSPAGGVRGGCRGAVPTTAPLRGGSTHRLAHEVLVVDVARVLCQELAEVAHRLVAEPLCHQHLGQVGAQHVVAGLTRDGPTKAVQQSGDVHSPRLPPGGRAPPDQTTSGRAVGGMGAGRVVEPIRCASTAAAAARPSAIAQTISDWPRPASPATNTPGTLDA